MIEIVMAIIACAFARRFAGGLLGQWFGPIGGTQVARLAASCLIGLAVAILAPVWWWGLAAVPLAFLGYASGFPPGGMVPKTPEHVGGISQQHGWAMMGPFALAAAVGGVAWWPFVAAALLVGPAYWLATVWQPRIPVLGLNRDGLPDPPALAEFMVGGILGAALILAIGR